MSTDERLNWAPSPAMTPFEILMWRAEADPAMRTTVVVVELLDTAPEWSRLVEAHEWATRMVPRLRERVVAPFLGTGTPYWEQAREFDLHYHLRRMRLPGEAGEAEVFAYAEQTAMTPLDPERPPWEATLIEGRDGGGAAYVLKTNHVISDGMGLSQLFSGLHSRTREHTTDKPQPSTARAATPSALERLARQVRGDAGVVADAARGAAGLLPSLRRPDQAVRDAVRYATSARRVLAPPSAPPLTSLAVRSASWRFAAFDLEFEPLRAAGKAAGASVNDAFLAGLLGGFRRYAEAHGELLGPGRTMPVTVPVSVRRPDDLAGGNRFAPGRLRAPVGIVDPAERIAAVHDAMIAARDEPALEVLDVVTPLLSRVPGRLLAAFGGGATGGNDLQASNIPGLREEVYLAGARIERIYPYAPLPGCAAMITMFSHAGSEVCVAANLDAGAVDPDELTDCLVDGFAEVLDLVPDAPRPVRRT